MSPALAATQTCRGVSLAGTNGAAQVVAGTCWGQPVCATAPTFAYLHCLFPLGGPEGLGVQTFGNQAADLETQCLPSLQDLAKEKLILGSLGHCEPTAASLHLALWLSLPAR